MAHSYQNQSRNATPTSELAQMQIIESRDASPATTTRSKRDHESVESLPTAPAQSEKERRVDNSAALSATNWDAQPDQHEPSRKHSTRSKLDALSKERETAARQVTIREPNDAKDGTSNVIKATALEAWRTEQSCARRTSTNLLRNAYTPSGRSPKAELHPICSPSRSTKNSQWIRHMPNFVSFPTVYPPMEKVKQTQVRTSKIVYVSNTLHTKKSNFSRARRSSSRWWKETLSF